MVSCCISAFDHSDGFSLFQKAKDFAGNRRVGTSISGDAAMSFRPARLEKIIFCYVAFDDLRLCGVAKFGEIAMMRKRATLARIARSRSI